MFGKLIKSLRSGGHAIRNASVALAVCLVLSAAAWLVVDWITYPQELAELNRQLQIEQERLRARFRPWTELEWELERERA
ncbi:MAG: hypothetical protein GY953_49830, partial [bacterium]|nr:hypothetical protein [bacterium]